MVVSYYLTHNWTIVCVRLFGKAQVNTSFVIQNCHPEGFEVCVHCLQKVHFVVIKFNCLLGLKNANSIRVAQKCFRSQKLLENKQTIPFRRKYNLENENIKVQTTEMEMQSQIKNDLGLLKPHLTETSCNILTSKQNWETKFNYYPILLDTKDALD